MTSYVDPAQSLRAASDAFDLLFANDLAGAVHSFGADTHRDSPFHLMGLGVCAFLKAALGMEVCLIVPGAAAVFSCFVCEFTII